MFISSRSKTKLFVMHTFNKRYNMTINYVLRHWSVKLGVWIQVRSMILDMNLGPVQLSIVRRRGKL